MKNLLQFIIRWIAICLSLAMVHSVPMKSIFGSKKNDMPVCTTKDCHEIGLIYKQNMNPRVNPCTDFYEYACGNWLTHNPKPESVNIWTVFTLVQQKADANLKILLENKKNSNFPQIERAKALYRSCLDLSVLDAFKTNVMKKVVAKIGNWPMFFPGNKELPADLPWWAIDDEYTKLTGESAFLNLKTVVNWNAGKKIILQLDRPFSPYGTIKITKDWKNPAEQKRHYRKFLRKVIELVAPRNSMPPADVLDQDLYKVIAFRDELRKIIQTAPIDAAQIITVGQVQDWYNRHSKAPQSKINWVKKISSAYKDSKDAYGFPVTTATLVKLFDRDYFVMLANLLGKTDKRTIVNHIHLYFSERNVQFDDAMIADLRNSISTDLAHNDKLRRKYQRWKWCILNHEMKNILGDMYGSYYFSRQQKVQVEHMVNEAKAIITAQVAGSNWVDPMTKNITARKIHHINSVVGYEEWTPTRADKRPKLINAMEVQAFYDPALNAMVVSAGYLQLPFYGIGMPYVIDYGATLTTISHELYHSVDAIGIKSDEHGHKPWWSDQMFAQYNNQAKCFQDQYNKYRDHEIKRMGIHLESAPPTTVNEDIADVMGLKVAYKGFKQKERKKTTCPVVPGFEKVGCDKLFFIAFANVFCAGNTPSTEKLVLQRDTHSLAKIRVNGAVANMPEFSAAFGCGPKDPLNLRTRCDLWTR